MVIPLWKGEYMKEREAEVERQKIQSYGRQYEKNEEAMKIFFQKEKREEKKRIDDLQAKGVLHPIMEECIRRALERAVRQ